LKVPTIPKHLFKYGIKPGFQGTERLYSKENRKGLHLAGLDTETIGGSLFRKNDLYTVQIVMDCLENSHIFFPETQGVENLLFFRDIAGKGGGKVFCSAHNAGFDLGSLLGPDTILLMKGKEVKGWRGKMVDSTSSFLFLRNKELDFSITITDSMSWFKMSLKKFAESYLKETKKLERPEFLGKRAPQNKEELEGFIKYAEKDALIQFEATKKIYSYCIEGMVKTCLTPAQLSGRVFKKHFLQDRVFLPNYKLLPLISRCYHGAQFTAFGRGMFEDINYYDINSLYPFAAINTALNFSNSELKPISLNEIEQGFSGFVGVKFKFPESENYPCLPVMSTIRGFPKLVFPLSGISYCTTEELKPALKKGCEVLGIMSYGWYPTEKDINHDLGKFMQDLYLKKESLDKIKEKEMLTEEQRDLRQYYKLLLNSLIGKFCQRNREWPGGREIAGSLFKPDFGSLVLSRSRAIINNLISKHGAIYSDTDCLLTKKRLETGTKIGQLKNELGKNVRGDLLAIRSKLYFVSRNGEMVKCAKHGFRQDSKETFKLLLKNRNKSYITYSVKRLTKTKEAFRRKMLPRREISQSFKIMLKDDGKRVYGERLYTVENLLNNNTLSTPLKKA